MSKLKFYQIPDQIVDNLVFILDHLYSINDGIEIEGDKCSTNNAFQTHNLISIKGDFSEFHILLKTILKEIGKSHLEYERFHMIAYNGEGDQDKHHHGNLEQYFDDCGTFVLYLSDANSGATVFEIDGKEIEVLPKRGQLVYFPTYVPHWANKVNLGDLKMIAVGALIPPNTTIPKC